MKSQNRIIVTVPVPWDGTGNARGGSSITVPFGAEQGRCDVVAPRKMKRIRFSAPNREEMDTKMKKHNILENIDDDDLVVLRFEIQSELQEKVGEIIRVVTDMHSFASMTKNVHKQIKNWSKHLKQLIERANKYSEICQILAEKESNRMRDLLLCYIYIYMLLCRQLRGETRSCDSNCTETQANNRWETPSKKKKNLIKNTNMGWIAKIGWLEAPKICIVLHNLRP
jgi:hypothetical protein